MSNPAARVRNFSASRADRSIVDGVSFDLAHGTVTALVGESGSGKTTTGLALLGETAPGIRASGEITVDGFVGYVPQHPSAVLNPTRRIGGVLTEIALRHLRPPLLGRRDRRRAARTRVIDALRSAHLPDPEGLLRRYPHQLSGGQQQRLVLAHALLCDANVVVADEPTTGQDPITRERVAGQLRALTERGITVLLLTHDLDLVRKLASDVLVMRHGRVVERGPVQQVLTSPAHEYTKALVEAQLSAQPGQQRQRSPSPLLSVRDLVAGHRDSTTLHGVSADVAAGERVAVVGRSGSGKTTLARCITGLHPRRRGHLTFEGRALNPDVRQRTPADLADIQYVFQDSRASFNEFTPVLDQVARTATRLRGTPPDTARALAQATLAKVGVASHTVTRRPAALSGGELQRAALARALLAEPRILICDEITSGLDTITRTGVLNLLQTLYQDTNSALILITHDLAVVAQLCDRVVVIDNGHIVEQGPTTQILNNPQHQLTKALAAGRELA